MEQALGARTDRETALYAYAATLSLSQLPAPTVESCAALVLDHVGGAMLGLTMPWTAALLATLETSGELRPAGEVGAHLYGRPEPIPPLTAVLVNGTAAHGFDLDDTHLPTMTHPGCAVIPAAVAAAELSGADGRDFLAAVVAGYEVIGRVARATGLGFGEKGFHATGQVGPLGAAAAATRLLAPGDQDAFAGAVGLAASFGGGIKAFSTGVGMVKRLHAGRAAQSGLFAALLQQSGFGGPPRAVAGDFGFVSTFSTDDAPEYGMLTEGLGETHVVDEVYLKPFAACGAVHGAMAAASTLSLRAPADVERVVVGTSRRALQQNAVVDPADVMAAQYSTPYSVALALLGGAEDPRRYLQAETGQDTAVRELAARVVMEVDDAAERAYPDANEARVEVWTNDGGRQTARGAVSAKTSRGWSVAEKKFLAVTDGLLPATSRQGVIDAVAALADGGPVRTCLDFLLTSQQKGPES